jgi:hypothetical protein
MYGLKPVPFIADSEASYQQSSGWISATSYQLSALSSQLKPLPFIAVGEAFYQQSSYRLSYQLSAFSCQLKLVPILDSVAVGREWMQLCQLVNANSKRR